MDYRANGNRIVDSAGQEIRLYGLNWFGFETGNTVFHGLWSRNLEQILDQVKLLGFNALRIPFRPGVCANEACNSVNYQENPKLQGKSSLEVLDYAVEALKARSMYFILDHHTPSVQTISELWYTPQYSEQQWIDDLVFMAKRYIEQPYFIGLDIKNEPHGAASWGTGILATDWNTAAEKAASAILSVNPRILIFVEGIENSGSGSYNNWWGGDLSKQKTTPLKIPAEKLVFAPHVYGPDVYNQPYFADSAFPANMPAVWEEDFGYLAKDRVVCPTEFGGRYLNKDKTLQDALVTYLVQKGIHNFFYWCLNPNSGDTGGILEDDWKTVREDKVALLRRLMASGAPMPEPKPSPEPVPMEVLLCLALFTGGAKVTIDGVSHDLKIGGS